jgi:hypothetical protein
MESPFRIEVYDKNFNFKGFVGDPISVVATPRYNQISTAVITVESDHLRIADLLADGARVVIRHRDSVLMSGKIHLRKADGPLVKGEIEIHVKDDFRLLHQTLGWPVPASPITNQTASEFCTYFGSAETVLKTAVIDNMINRLGLPVTSAPNQVRGAAGVSVSFRFHSLYDKLFPAIEQAGLGVTFKQTGATIVCDVFTPPVFARPLTEKSGVITTWAWSSDDAQATRVVGGGDGETTARMFRQVTDPALETAHREVFEVFEDAPSADTEAELLASAQENLDENAPKSGFGVSLSETEHFQYGKDGLVVGAMVTIDLGFITRTDILRECTLSFTRDDGYEATPIIGDINDNPDRAIGKFLARLKKGISDLKVSK